MPRPKGASVTFRDEPDFQEWFRATHGADPAELTPHAGECDACGRSDVPLLLNECDVCLAGQFGMAMGERRIADAIRKFVHVLVHGSPEAAKQIVSQAMFALADLVGPIAVGPSDHGKED